MCFGIRIWSPFHLATQIISIHNLNCPKNTKKNACADMIFLMLFHECGMFFHNWVIFFHECGMHQTSISNVCHLYLMLTLKNQRFFGNLKQPSAWNRDSICSSSSRSCFTSERWGEKPCVFAFLGQFRFWMDIISVARWKSLEILIPNHMWKSKIRLLEQK